MSLRYRLNLVIVVICLSTVLLGSVAAVINARQSVLEEISSTLALAEKLLGYELDNRQIDSLDKIRHLRVSAIFNEKNSRESLLNGDSIEIENVPLFFIKFVRPGKEQLSYWLEAKSGSHLLSLVADPSDEITEAWRETSTFIALLLLMTVLVSFSVFIVTGRALKPVDQILEAFSELEEGDYEKRLPSFNLPEFARISKAFNHMASMLEQAQQENRRLTQKALQVRENERRYLARELHDELGQSLSAIKALSASAKQSQESLSESLDKIADICDHLFDVVRNMMRQLSPPLLNEFGLQVALEELVGRWTQQSGLTVSLQLSESIDALVGDNAIHFYRIVQESLTNVLKHSGAKQILIKLSEKEESGACFIGLKIVDDGCGFDVGKVEWGGGLVGIKERVESANGRFSLISKRGEGCQLFLLLPVSDQNG
jgi:two-component system sensor histidine kinase UhpB